MIRVVDSAQIRIIIRYTTSLWRICTKVKMGGRQTIFYENRVPNFSKINGQTHHMVECLSLECRPFTTAHMYQQHIRVQHPVINCYFRFLNFNQKTIYLHHFCVVLCVLIVVVCVFVFICGCGFYIAVVLCAILCCVK